MKINVLILAGGVGQRMGSKVPKQFIEVEGVPIIVKTIKNFENNNRVDDIAVVCVPQFKKDLEHIIKKFDLKKVKYIIEGGATCHDSTRNGVFFFENILTSNDYLIIHDAVRPILPQANLNEMIDVALKNGNACFAVPCYETVICTSDGVSGNKEIDRNSFRKVQTPQMYNYQTILELYKRAEKDNIHNFVYANTMAIHYGMTIYFSRGFQYNYKITTKEDLPAYKAFLELLNEEI